MRAWPRRSVANPHSFGAIFFVAAASFERMSRRDVLALVLGVAAAAVFVRLGLWQLDRRTERLTWNRGVAARMLTPPVSLDSLPADPARARWRRVRLVGRLDLDRELALAARTHGGSPGVHLLAALRRPGRDTAILVVRGWVYAADGATTDFARWRGDSLASVGYVETFPELRSPLARSTTNPRLLYQLDRAAASTALGVPLAPYYIVRGDVPVADSVGDAMASIEPPPLDEGPHLNYALQWFAFAIIALVGVGTYVRRNRTRRA